MVLPNIPITLNDEQFQKLIEKLSTDKTQLFLVFASAFLAMLVGVVIEAIKDWDEKRKKHKLNNENHELDINAALVAIAYNFEVLGTQSFDTHIPYYKQTHSALQNFQTFEVGSKEYKDFVINLTAYPELIKTWPKLHLIEIDFLNNYRFLIRKNAEILKSEKWAINYIRELQQLTIDRNEDIKTFKSSTKDGIFSHHQFDILFQSHASYSEAACMLALQILDKLSECRSFIEKVMPEFSKNKREAKIQVPQKFEQLLEQLRAINQANNVVMQEQ
jgi:hypothetical protein